MTENGISKKRDWSSLHEGTQRYWVLNTPRSLMLQWQLIAQTVPVHLRHDRQARHARKYAISTRALWASCKRPASRHRVFSVTQSTGSSVWHKHVHSSHIQRMPLGLGTRIFTIGNISPVTVQSQRQWPWPCSLVCMHKSMYACTITESCLPMSGWPGRPGRQNNRGIKHCMYHPVLKSYNKGTCTCILYKTFSTWGIGYVTVDRHLAIKS